MLFSVLIAHYNNTRFLAEAIKSVLQQTYHDWEIILVDDCSTEDFDTVMQPFLHEDRLRIYRNAQNMGCGFTKKKCASLASGALMGFLDPDDVLLPTALERMTLMHRIHPDCSLVYSTHFVCDEGLLRCREADYVKPLPPETLYLFVSDGSVHHFASFKKSAYLQTPGLDAKNQKAVDQDLYYLLEEQGPFFFLDELLYKYRIHDKGISTSGKEDEAARWHLRVIINACNRRLKKMADAGDHRTKAYRQLKQRRAKAMIQMDYRSRRWARFILHGALYPFQGGSSHLFSYLKKLLTKGPAVLRKSFRDNHQILP